MKGKYSWFILNLVFFMVFIWGVSCSDNSVQSDAGRYKDQINSKRDIIIGAGIGSSDVYETENEVSLNSDTIVDVIDMDMQGDILDVVDNISDLKHDVIKDKIGEFYDVDNGKTGDTAILDDGIACDPGTCEELGKECGIWPDGCGGQLNCGSCGQHEACIEGKCQPQPFCGDGKCQSNETCASCEADCGKCCGNGKCEADFGENCSSCPDDCGTCMDCSELDNNNELIADRHFHRGFIPMDRKTYKPEGKMPTDWCKGAPIWQLTQWDSLGDLYNSTKQILSDGSVMWSNEYGHIILGKPNTQSADMIMAVWAYKEYGGQYHTPTPQRKWVHMLAEQRISPPGINRPGSPPLSHLAHLNFNVVAQLLKDVPHHQNGYDPKKYAAQFLIYFTIQNLNHNSPGFGDYLWFGVTLYDDRYDVVPLSMHGDLSNGIGTGKFIYNIGSEPFVSKGLTPGGPEKRFSKDILPDIRNALLEAWKRGFLKDSHVLSDYRIGGMNIGWEVPGLNDVELRVRDLSLRYEVKTAKPIVFDFNRDGDTEGWTAHNMTDLYGGPKDGKWILDVPGSDPSIVSPPLNIEAAAYRTLRITFANNHNPANTSRMQVFWDRFGDHGFREAWSVWVDVSNGGGWSTIEIDMSKNPAWTGEIRTIRIDPIISGDGHAVGFDKIEILP